MSAAGVECRAVGEVRPGSCAGRGHGRAGARATLVGTENRHWTVAQGPATRGGTLRPGTAARRNTRLLKRNVAGTGHCSAVRHSRGAFEETDRRSPGTGLDGSVDP